MKKVTNKSYSQKLNFFFNNPVEKRKWNKMTKGMESPALIVFDPESYGFDGDLIPIEVYDQDMFSEEDGFFRIDAHSQYVFDVERNFYKNYFLPNI